MKNWNNEEIIGNKQEAIEQAIESLKDAYTQISKGLNERAKDNIECALNRLGVVELTAEEVAEKKRNEYIKMSF